MAKRVPKPKTTTCKLCRMPVEQSTGKGRTKLYHAECRRVDKAVTLLLPALEGMTSRVMKASAKNALRGELMGASNILNRVKTVK